MVEAVKQQLPAARDRRRRATSCRARSTPAGASSSASTRYTEGDDGADPDAAHRPARSSASRSTACRRVRARRDAARGRARARARCSEAAARDGANLMPHLLDAARAHGTEGEIVEALQDVCGDYRDAGVLRRRCHRVPTLREASIALMRRKLLADRSLVRGRRRRGGRSPSRPRPPRRPSRSGDRHRSARSRSPSRRAPRQLAWTGKRRTTSRSRRARTKFTLRKAAARRAPSRSKFTRRAPTDRLPDPRRHEDDDQGLARPGRGRAPAAGPPRRPRRRAAGIESAASTHVRAEHHPARSASSSPSPASTGTTAARRSSPARCATRAWR